VAAKGDPGYAATAVMLAESGLLVALGDPELPDRAGVLTPATGLGMPLVERLRAADFTFDVQRWEPPASEEAADEDAAPASQAADGGEPSDG
jgi:hypothetical protein